MIMFKKKNNNKKTKDQRNLKMIYFFDCNTFKNLLVVVKMNLKKGMIRFDCVISFAFSNEQPTFYAWFYK